VGQFLGLANAKLSFKPGGQAWSFRNEEDREAGSQVEIIYVFEQPLFLDAERGSDTLALHT